MRNPGGSTSALNSWPWVKPGARSARSVHGWIVAVLIGTMLSFGGSTLYSHHIASRIDANAMVIASSALPSIEQLIAARRETFRIQLAALGAVQDLREGASVDRTPMNEATARLHERMSAYLSLPFSDNERSLYTDAEQSTRDLDAELAHFLTRVDARDGQGAVAVMRTGLAPAALRTDQAIERLIMFDAGEQHRLGEEIPALRRHAARIGAFLQCLSALFALSLMGLVLRAARRYGQIQDEEQRLTELRANDLEAFSAKVESIVASSVAISDTIGNSGNLRMIFQTIADQARTLITADYCALGFGSDPEQTSEPWVFSGIRQDHPPRGPFLGVPLLHEGRSVGDLYLARVEGRKPFSEDDQRVIALLAAYVGVAIDNARLYAKAQTATHLREDLLATVSHDLKNLLNVVRLSATLLKKETAGSSTLVARIDRVADRMTRLIDDLLDAAKIEAGLLRTVPKPETVDALTEEAVEMFSVLAAAKSIEITRNLQSVSLVVQCERDSIQRVFANLLGNAIKFTPKDGSISIAADEREGQICFSVTDTGPGIPTDLLPHIFDRYWQQKEGDRQGSGLGLFIAKGIVEAHGGRIWAEGSRGKGAKIRFTLPRSSASRSSAESPCAPLESAL